MDATGAPDAIPATDALDGIPATEAPDAIPAAPASHQQLTEPSQQVRRMIYVVIISRKNGKLRQTINNCDCDGV